MRRSTKIGGVSGVILALGVMGLLVTVLGGEETKEIVVTIEGLSSADKAAAFARGEDLRKGMKFAEAIKEYQKVVAGGEPCALEAEAQYDIGLCYTWLGERDKAEAVFQRMLQTYADNGEAVANAEYGLAWVEIQKGELDAAVARLERMLREQTCEDRELYARAQFQIGRIYLAFVHDYEEAQAAFRKLLANYPDSELVSHPFLDALRAER